MSDFNAPRTSNSLEVLSQKDGIRQIGITPRLRVWIDLPSLTHPENYVFFEHWSFRVLV